jgi:hypothetical protein
MKYLKTFENMINQYDFNKCIYIADDKSIVGPYMIIDENENFISLLNIKERVRDYHLFMDNAQSYDITIHRISLPKTNIEVVGDVIGKEGFKYIKLPYWLYKKNINDLEVKRIKGTWDGVKYKKRLDIPVDKLLNSDFINNFKDDNVINYIRQTNDDNRTNYLITNYNKNGFN